MELRINLKTPINLAWGIMLSVIAIVNLIIVFSLNHFDAVILSLLSASIWLGYFGYFDRLFYEKSTEQLVHQKGLLIPFYNHKYQASAIKSIAITNGYIHRDGGSTEAFVIKLRGIKNAELMTNDNFNFTNRISNEIALFLNKPLVNETGEI